MDTENRYIAEEMTNLFHDAQGGTINKLKEGSRDTDVEIKPFKVGIESISETLKIKREWDDRKRAELEKLFTETVVEQYNEPHVSELNTDQMRVWHMGLFGTIELIRQHSEWKHYDTVEKVIDDYIKACEENLLQLREKYANRMYRMEDIVVGEKDNDNDDNDVIIDTSLFGYGLSTN